MAKMTTYKFTDGSGSVKTKDIREFVKRNFGDILDKVVINEEKREITINLTLIESMQRAKRLADERKNKES